MLRATFFVLSALSFSTSFASPTPGAELLPRSCNPNFQGLAQTIFAQPPITDIGVFEWTPASIAPGAHITLQQRSVTDAFAKGEFLVQSTGQPNGSYLFKLADDSMHYIALTAGAGGALAFDIASGASIPSQEFAITCDCPTELDGRVGHNCRISHPASGKCVTGSTSGSTLHLAGCGSAGVYSFLSGLVRL